MSNLIYRDKKKRNLHLKYETQRLEYKSILNDLSLPKELRYNIMLALNKLPRNSSKVRIKNRCILTSRTHSVLRICKLSRIKFRELASQGLLMGIKKSSW
jgi:small subunit ribosomal protein S14